ncbi:MAG: Mth938-like domain-containing protein [Steroidobacteraceae bacterium]
MADNRTTANLVRSYARSEIRIGDTLYTRPLRLAASSLELLTVQTPQELGDAEFEPLLALRPELVIVGWGGGQLFLPAAQRSWFLQRRIGIETMELGAACRTYNLLVQDERAVIALLFPLAA